MASDRRSIELLPDPLIDQIAAGEVVERPASLIKELVENSIDAGATRIEVSIERGGLDLVQIVDDGSGILQEDLPLAVVAHATSKIRTAEDLTAIVTRGFRGEALASMGAVGRLELTSRTEGADSGWELVVNQGQPSAVRPAALATGTRVIVRKLFAHIPARRKFLKGDRAETNRCQEATLKMALATPSIHFVFRVDGRVRCDWPATDGAGRVRQVLKLNDVREGQGASGGVSVRVWIAPPAESRATRTGQYFFLGGRPIRDRALSQVAWQSTREFIPDKKHALFVADIDVDPDRIDVNVHPTKEEVRFEEPRRVAAALSRALRDAMAEADYAAPLLTDLPLVRESVTPPASVPKGAEPMSLPRARRGTVENWADDGLLGATESMQPEALPNRAFLQIHNSFIVVETDAGMSIFDQHALHERVLLQKMRDDLSRGSVERQSLLLPHLVDLLPAEVAVLLDMKEDIAAVGFDIEDHGGGVVAVSGLPVTLAPASLQGFFQDLIEAADGLPDTQALREKTVALCACRSAVKAGEKLEKSEIEALLKGFKDEDFTFACEHGRPTQVHISLAELARGFTRH